MVDTSLESVVEVCVCVLERLVLVVSDVGVGVAIAGLNRFGGACLASIPP